MEPARSDIIFDCPHCGKSLAIDPRGAGMVVACPDCQQEVSVPGLPPAERQAADNADAAVVAEGAGGEQLQAAHSKIERLVESLEEVRDRRAYLEQLRTDNMARFEQIGKELVVVQNAIDRIVALLQDAAGK